MKKLFIFAMAIGLTACVKDDVNVGLEGDGTQQYLSINIIPAPDNGTRAEGGTQTGDPDNAIYEEGYSQENAVTNVRFYFFKANGDPAIVKKDSLVNYFNYGDSADESITDSGNKMPNIEKLLNAIVVIETPKGDKLPEKIVAILNPNYEALGNDGMSLSDLRKRTKDYAATAATTSGNFVMMNAVYADENNAEVAATEIPVTKYAASADAAKENPVDIYVERNVAKVRVHFGNQISFTGTDLIALKDKDDQDIKVTDGGEEKQVYLKISKWALTAYTNHGYLSKHIDPTTWNTGKTLFGSAEWNWTDYCRSYWAQNPSEDDDPDFAQTWITYNDIANGKSYGTALENSIYTNENAPQDKVTDAALNPSQLAPFTKVILAGQLVDQDGTAVELTKYAGITYIGESGLKEALLNNLKGNNMIYSYDSAGEEGKKYTEISLDDVEFKTATAVGKAQEEEDNDGGRYYVYLQLSETGREKTWTKSDSENSYQNDALDTQQVNELLINSLGKAQIFKSGYTYYYFPIEHLGDTGNTGKYGVVRNHIYDCQITKIAGLGTPVYDPTDKIYPEHTDEDETYIAARINILSWRLINHDYELEW